MDVIIKNKIQIICSRLFYRAFLNKHFRLLGVCMCLTWVVQTKDWNIAESNPCYREKNNCTAFFTSIGFTQLQIIWKYYC